MEIIHKELASLNDLLQNLLNTKWRKSGNNLQKKKDLINSLNKIIKIRKLKNKAIN